MNRLGLLLVIGLVPFCSFGQGSSYSWSETAHSFGTVPETGGDIQHRFVLKNTGKTSLHIISAFASCGCTTPQTNKAPIAPGDTGSVLVVYHPAGRPGSFRKSVTVTTDGEPAVSELVISGSVKPRELTPDESYPDTLGNGLRIATRYLNLGEVSPFRGVTEAEYDVYNSGKAPISLKAVKLPKWMKLTMKPAQLPPGQQGKMVLTYSGKARKDFGYVTDPVDVQVQGIAPSKPSTLFVMVSLQESPPALSKEQMAEREHLMPIPADLNFGRVEGGKVHTAEFVLRNTGKSPLKIYAVKAGCKCLRTELVDKKIAPGGSATLYVHFDTNGYVGEFSKALTVYSSDPSQPALSMSVRARVENPPGKSLPAVE